MLTTLMGSSVKDILNMSLPRKHFTVGILITFCLWPCNDEEAVQLLLSIFLELFFCWP